MYKLNESIEALYCIKCGTKYDVEDFYYGCPKCYEKGERASLGFIYNNSKIVKADGVGIQKYSNRLPYIDLPSMGEGNTPVVSIDRLAEDLELKSVHVKNEFQNPTGSHKDRMSPLIIARAKELGKNVVVAASSGNAGSSLAAYAAYAGLECKIIATDKITPIWKKSITATGADLVITETSRERWQYMKEQVETEGWYPVTNFISPPVSSNCFGVQGYKTVAYEIYDYFGDNIPDYLFVPVARGDLMWGIYEGLKELKELSYITEIPKIVAVEPFTRISKVLNGVDYRTEFDGEYSKTESIGGGTVTYQSYVAVKESNGFAVEVYQDEIENNINEIARYGFYLESSSATVLGGLRKAIANGRILKGSSVLLIATSNGFKNMPVEGTRN